MSQLIGAIRAVRAVQAFKMFKAVDSDQSMFSRFDLWSYEAITDNVLCDRCSWYAAQGEFQGDMLHGLFPDLEIINEDEIEVHVHINCRCRLKRVTT